MLSGASARRPARRHGDPGAAPGPAPPPAPGFRSVVTRRPLLRSWTPEAGPSPPLGAALPCPSVTRALSTPERGNLCGTVGGPALRPASLRPFQPRGRGLRSVSGLREGLGFPSFHRRAQPRAADKAPPVQELPASVLSKGLLPASLLLFPAQGVRTRGGGQDCVSTFSHAQAQRANFRRFLSGHPGAPAPG